MFGIIVRFTLCCLIFTIKMSLNILMNRFSFALIFFLRNIQRVSRTYFDHKTVEDPHILLVFFSFIYWMK